MGRPWEIQRGARQPRGPRSVRAVTVRGGIASRLQAYGPRIVAATEDMSHRNFDNGTA
jgi:hypothetical protein